MENNREVEIALAKTFVSTQFNEENVSMTVRNQRTRNVYEAEMPEKMKERIVEIEGTYEGAGTEDKTVILKSEDITYTLVIGNETIYSRSIMEKEIESGECLYTAAVKVEGYPLYVPVFVIRKSEKEFFMKIESLFGRINAIKNYYELDEDQQEAIVFQAGLEKNEKNDEAEVPVFETRRQIILWYEMVKETLPSDTKRTIERMLQDKSFLKHKVDGRLQIISRISPRYAKRKPMDTKEMDRVFNERFFKMDKPKQLIKDVFTARERADKRGCAILFVGAPGVGKTSLMMTIAEVLNLPFECLALNGLSNPLELEGLNSGYENADAGIIAKTFASHGTSEMVLGLDEFDKMHRKSKEGDPMNIFLRLFLGSHYDKFLECTIKTENTVFIATANSVDDIPETIINRFDSIIYFDEYSVEDKIEIAKKFVIPELLSKYSISEDKVKFNDKAIECIITRYCEDDGVRDLRHNIETVIARVIGCNMSDTSMMINDDFVEKVLFGLVEETPGLYFARNRRFYTESIGKAIKKSLIATKKTVSEDSDTYASEKERQRLEYLLACKKEEKGFLEGFAPLSLYNSLHQEMFGMENVIKEVVNFFFSEYLRGSNVNSNLALCGGYGVGKSSIIKNIADTIGYKYVKISLNGVEDSRELRGFSSTYQGSEPGRIVKGIKQAGSVRMILQLDEIDKLRVEYSTTILDLLDREFTDNFLDVPIDMSQTIIIATANDWGKVPAVVRDRFIVVDVAGYTREEKRQIIENYVIPKLEKCYEASGVSIKMNESGMEYLLKNYASSFGVRDAEKAIQRICTSKLVDQQGRENPMQVNIGKQDIRRYLGDEPIPRGNFPQNEMVPGVSKALSVMNGNIGNVFAIETVIIEDREGLEITGLPKEMAIDSVKVCVTCIKKMYPKLLKNKYIHVHFGEGSIQKDGPSAGAALFMSILSSAIKIPVTTNNKSYDVACTGEISLTGGVFAVGEIMEKLQAACDSGCSKVFIPMQNYERLDKKIVDAFECNVIPVTHISQIVEDVYPDIENLMGGCLDEEAM